MNDNYLLKLYHRFESMPFGKRIFAFMFARKAPYFSTISPRIQTLRPNFCDLTFAKRRKVANHIGSVHVIAICNGMEMAMGALAEASIPRHLRWIPKGMQVNYTAKANSNMRITAETQAEDWKPGELPVAVKAWRDDGTVVVEGIITLHISDKPQRSEV